MPCAPPTQSLLAREMEEDDSQPTLQVSPGALLSGSSKEGKKERRKGGGLSLGRSKQGTERAFSKKGKHTRNKSGSRSPPDSPRSERFRGGGKSQPSPNVKGHRKRYSQLGLNLSSEEESDEEEGEEDEENDEQGQTYFKNKVAAALGEGQEPLFVIEKDSKSSQPVSPGGGVQSSVQFPVRFDQSWPTTLPLSSAFEPQPTNATPLSPTSNPLIPSPSPVPPLAPPAPAPAGPWTPSLLPFTTSDTLPVTAVEVIGEEQEEREDEKTVMNGNEVPEIEWRVSTELKLKCHKQFLDLHPTDGRLQGDQARNFFIQSHLPNSDLSAIWRLADMDRDNALSEEEFTVAMKLVLLRRKGYSLPSSLPLSLKESSVTEPRKKVGTLQTSHTVGELPLPQSEGLLIDISESPKGGDGVTSDNEREERGEPAVATIISLDEDSSERQKTNVRRALSLKDVSPPPLTDDRSGGHNSPPPSPFSPPPAETAPILSFHTPSPKHTHSSKVVKKSGYSVLRGNDDEEHEEMEISKEEIQQQQLAVGRERGHGRSTSLDLNKMIPGSSVLSDMPAAEPPRPPPKPSTEDNELLPQLRGRSASTGSISSTGPTSTAPTVDSTAYHSPATRKIPLIPPVPKPRRPPPPKKEDKQALVDNSTSEVLVRDKSELQMTIRSLKDTNATLQVLNRELEEKLFRLMEDRVQLAREVELARQMQTTS